MSVNSKITEAISKLVNGENLSGEEVSAVFCQIMEGKATNAQMASFLTALRIKGETVEEITAAAKTIQGKSIPFDTKNPDIIDIVGTGGDNTGTFNISTAAAFIAAGAGAPVTKHGNRSVSSQSGAADVLEALGANINLPPDKSLLMFKKIGFCFLFAQNHHPCMGFVAPVRQEIGIRTLFNIIGPTVNPARAKKQLIGVYDKSLVEPLAKVLKNLGITRGITLHSEDGLDEAAISAPTLIAEIKEGRILSYTIKPEDFNLKYAPLEDIKGGNDKENAQIILNIFNKKDRGAKRDIAVLNAALLLYLTDKSPTIKDGVELAKASIDNGSALKTLTEFIELSNTLKET